MALPAGTTLVKSFPFDSNPELVTDVNGYLSGDRSVDAWTMQRTFKQFFSDGVFGTPANALRIGKAATGLAVTVQPGMFIIEGGMGGILESDGPITLTLDTGSAAGNVCYGVMLRYDNNADMRSLGIRIVKGTAGASPQPPEPDQTSANVMEYRLGYITVPNGATDLANATITNEKGTASCPYAAPFVEIDMSEVTTDAEASANAALDRLYEYFDTYRDAIDAALSDEEVTYLQQQINTLAGQIKTLDLASEVDGVTIEYAKEPGEMDSKLRVKDGGVSTGKIADFSVLPIKLSADLQIQLGVLDQTGWDFDQYMEFVGELDDGTKKSYLQDTFDMSVFNGWTVEQKEEFTHSLDGECFDVFFERVDLDGFTWTDLVEYANSFTGQQRSKFVGKQKTVNSHIGSAKFICVGVDHYQGVQGLVFYGKGQAGIYNDGNREVLYKNSKLYSYSQTTFLNSMDADLQGLMKTCPIITHGYSDNPPATTETLNLKIWTPSSTEITNCPTGRNLVEGTQYQYFAEGGAASGIAQGSWTRTANARASYGNAGNAYIYMVNNNFPSGSGAQCTMTYQSGSYPRNIAFCV